MLHFLLLTKNAYLRREQLTSGSSANTRQLMDGMSSPGCCFFVSMETQRSNILK